MLRVNKLKSVVDKFTTLSQSSSSSSLLSRSLNNNNNSQTKTTTISTLIMSQQKKKPTIQTKAKLPKISQCAAALQGNRFYSTKPGFKPAPYLGPPPTLNEIVKLELLQKESPETIKEIWLRYHSKKDSICAVIPAETYNKLKQRAKSCPLFVFPLPGDKGYISILYQWQEDYFMYTYLDQYKKYTVNAVPWLSAAHYTDLLESKGIVLMRADPNLEVLNTVQAQFLYNQTQIFLLDDKKFNIMQTFTYNPQRFDFNAVLREINDQKSMLETVQDPNDKSHKIVNFDNNTASGVNSSNKEDIAAAETTSTTTTTSTKVETTGEKESQEKNQPITMDTYKVKPSLSATTSQSSSSLD
ncbi:hypothetical protein PPL_00061 [Heterostelium album PN500]|uniref:ATP synthase mitochondrial F1 complex assembly factor 1 n=1 Tax=Heterostelium pallidum (strain ATCC 26659 / Pp 5 / PN500) TaxID=670386 RepID=D3BVQ9_HETP5|nr:hypothetical protein PPL_00061 [Heterostelium album PN500]EFA74562.1 hypothetical protein PPL_00061 [Heterostelium album PN500]|eukprot:XP_020426696.1 hypothetical protein PPL_00061 [Heterostelium album PN500]